MPHMDIAVKRRYVNKSSFPVSSSGYLPDEMVTPKYFIPEVWHKENTSKWTFKYSEVITP